MDEEEFTELCKRLKACDFSLMQGIIKMDVQKTQCFSSGMNGKA